MTQDSENRTASGSRRGFLQSAVLGTVGSVLAVDARLASTAHAAGSDETLKVALIGCGGRGTGAAEQALSTAGSVKLWAMADAFEDRLESSLKGLNEGLSARYDREKSGPLANRIDVPKERRFVGLDAYRKAIDSGVDVVIITGPPGFRPQHFEYAVKAGKHVFMEKPVATDAHGIRRILKAAEEAKKKDLKVGVGLQRHHQPSYQEAIQRIQDNQLGRIITLSCFWNTQSIAKHPIAREESVSELQHQVRNWYYFHWLSGDHICEQHVHNLDVCNWVKDAHPVSAEGMGGRQVRIGKENGDIFDHHAVIYTYADGTKMHSYCRQMPGCQSRVAEVVEGTKGLADLNSGSCKLTSGSETLWRSRRNRKSPYQVEHDVLFDAIRNNKPHNEAETGAFSTMTAILGRLATYSGKSVAWDEALASEPSITTDEEDWSADAPAQIQSDGSYVIAVPGVTKVLG